MLTGSARIVHGLQRAFLAVGVSCAVFLCAGRLAAQGDRDKSLTDAFEGLSAKERSRIAAKEVEEANSDVAYQQVMNEAEAHFQAGRYEEALASYRKARDLRPFNVYPKVKIEDLAALIAPKGPAGTPAAQASAPEPASTAVGPLQPTAPASTAVVPAAVTPAQERSTPITAPGPTTAPGRSEASAAPAWPGEGWEERRYKEGNAFVIERSLLVDGERVVYKRVQHPWGQVFYFRNTEPVDPRVWKVRFQEP